MLAAMHNLDGVVLHSPTDTPCLEALIMLASLRAFPRTGLSPTDAVQERIRSKELYERVLRVIDSPLDAPVNPKSRTRSLRDLGEDVDLYVEIASLWQSEHADRAGKALKEAVRISRTPAASSAIPRPKLLNNLAVVHHLEGAFADARALYEEALPIALADPSDESEASSVTILYNLARVYEDVGEQGMAKDAYNKLLSRHPEYTDGSYSIRSPFACEPKF